MKRQSLVLLAVAIVAAGAAGCFKDPVGNLRGGPAVLNVDHSNVVLRTGDSTAVTATLLDNAGNQLAVTGVTWTSVDPTVAVVRNDLTQAIPGNAYSKGFIRGVNVDGGWTDVIVSSRDKADTIRVVVMPATLVAAHVATAGPALTDTVIVPADAVANTPAKYIAYTAKDTLILSGTSTLTFDTSKVTVSVSTTNGASKGFIVAKSPSQIKVMFEVGTAGKVMVQHLLLKPGPASIGTIAVDTLITDSVAVGPVRIGPAAFGITAAVASNVLTVTAGPGMTFDSTTSLNLGPNAGVVIARTATTISAFSPVAYNGSVTLLNPHLTGTGPGAQTVTFDSLTSNVGPLGAMTPANLPNANVAFSPNNGKLGDTLVITAPAGFEFTTSGAVSQAIEGNTAIATSDTAWNLSVTAGSIKAFPRRGGSGSVTVTNVLLSVPGAVPFSLTTPGTFAIDSVNSDIPVSQVQAASLPLVIPANDTAIVYGTALPGALNGGFAQSYHTFTTTATHNIFVQAAWFGSGNPYSSAPNNTANTEDLDLLLCNVSTACDESAADLGNFAGATTVQPQQFTVNSLPAAQYWVNVAGFNVHYTIIYQLTVILQ